MRYILSEKISSATIACEKGICLLGKGFGISASPETKSVLANSEFFPSSLMESINYISIALQY